MVDPATQQVRSVKLERENYVEHLRVLLYSTTSARFVPFVVHQAFLHDFIPFGTMATRFNMGGPATSRGMYFSVTCSEATPFITDREIATMTEQLLELSISEHGPYRRVRPEIVLEVAFDLVQVSNRHKSGFALRFPRIARWRHDKSVRDIDTLSRVSALADAHTHERTQLVDRVAE